MDRRGAECAGAGGRRIARTSWDRGAQITFVIEDDRVKFDVNPDAAARAGLTISSKLLRVARSVEPRRSH